MTGLRIQTGVVICLLSLSHWLLSCSAPGEKSLTIAAAANLQPVMDRIINRFDSIYGIKCQLILNASGKITAQILHGAPYDVFLSADMNFPQQLTEAGVTASDPVVYTRGALVLLDLSGSPIPSLNRLLNPDIRHIAVANPEVAPYGRAAIECLENMGILDQVRSKLVYGESIGQTTQFVQSGAAELGFTAGSYRFSTSLPPTTHWLTIPDSLYHPIEQGGVIVLHNGAPHPQAESFLSFLTSPTAQEIFLKSGYLPVVNE